MGGVGAWVPPRVVWVGAVSMSVRSFPRDAQVLPAFLKTFTLWGDGCPVLQLPD